MAPRNWCWATWTMSWYQLSRRDSQILIFSRSNRERVWSLEAAYLGSNDKAKLGSNDRATLGRKDGTIEHIYYGGYLLVSLATTNDIQ